ncbi:MAG: class I SAM-dependent methyltransferase [Candidatus Bathyarchaeota archaeon]|jgi:ubiquinone/menaquinone biosynthesis C-methylase UbiE
MGKWYHDMFKGELGKYFLHLSALRKELTGKQIQFLESALKKGLILDHCCGAGRLSIPLSFKRQVIGLDLSKYLLVQAKRRGREAGAENLWLICCDMRHLPLRPSLFDSAINFWTSFGFFSQEENEVVLKEIIRVLKEKGTFIIDIGNPEWIITNFQDKHWDERDDFYMLAERSFNWENKRNITRWIFIDKKSRKIDEITFDHRLYSLQEFKKLYKKLGLAIQEVYGSCLKEPFEQTKSNRIVMVAEKES